MPTFAFQARTKSGEQVRGTREAADKRAALEALRAAELFVTELQALTAPLKKTPNKDAVAEAAVPQIAPQAPRQMPQIADPATRQNASDGEPQRTAGAMPLPTQPLLFANSKAVSLYFRQLYAMLNAGTGIAHALNTMATHAPSAGLRSASRQMSERTAAGHPVAEQMRAFPGLFSDLQIGLIEAGENGGFLDRMSLRLAEYAEKDYELEQAIKRETWYPKLLVFCSILIPSSVPTVLAVHFGGNAFSAFIHAVGPKFAVLFLVWAGWKIAKRFLMVGAHGGPLRELIDGAKFVLPIQAKVTRALAAAKFCRAMGALYAAGMGAGRIVDVAAGACGNAAFAARVRKIIPVLQNGGEMTAALASTRQFPPVAIQMMYTGEASGRLDEQMDKVADFLEADAETAIKQAVKVFGILVFLVIAVIIGAQVIAQYTGVLNDTMKEFDDQ